MSALGSVPSLGAVTIGRGSASWKASQASGDRKIVSGLKTVGGAVKGIANYPKHKVIDIAKGGKNIISQGQSKKFKHTKEKRYKKIAEKQLRKTMNKDKPDENKKEE